MTKVIYKMEFSEFIQELVPIAFFPEELANNSPHTCLCYRHLGQHGIACVQYAASLKPAQPDQYVKLHWELTEVVGYKDLKVVKKFTQKSREERTRKIK